MFRRPYNLTVTIVMLVHALVPSLFLYVDSFVPRIVSVPNIQLIKGEMCQSYWPNKQRISFISNPTKTLERILKRLIMAAASSSDGPAEEEDDEVLLQDDDWRAFRAKLVKGEQKSKINSTSTLLDSQGLSNEGWQASSSTVIVEDQGDLDGIGSLFRDDFVEDPSLSDVEQEKISGMTPLDPSQWAYDSGDVIEQGAVILGGVEQEFGFGLRQQYFHKAAILVLDHSETFTKGIILNRPTDLTLEDDINPGVKWRVWFGGDVEGLNARHPDIVCLHSLKIPKATKASIQVMKDIQWTTFENAKVIMYESLDDFV